ncbi:ty3-gypsy retrotransposon protein [Tanacetum coccineum]
MSPGNVAREGIPFELFRSTYPGRHVARETYPQRQVARDTPDLSLGNMANVVVTFDELGHGKRSKKAPVWQKEFECFGLDVPKFSGVDTASWIFAIKEYFLLLNTPAQQRLWIVGFNLEGAAAEWFRWMTRNGLITTWDRFEESLINSLGPSKYEDPQGMLSKLLQLGTVEDYQREFEKLMNRVTDILESLLIPFYISWLKLHLQRELLVSKPTTLGDAFALARMRLVWRTKQLQRWAQ